MSGRLCHDDTISHLGLALADLTAVTPHQGYDHQRQIEIRWKCTRLEIPEEAALQLWKALGKVLSV